MVPDRPDTLRTYLWSGTHDPVSFFRSRNAYAFSTHFLYYDRSNYSGYYVCHTGFTIVDLLYDERDVFSIIALWCATAIERSLQLLLPIGTTAIDWTGIYSGQVTTLATPNCCHRLVDQVVVALVVVR